MAVLKNWQRYNCILNLDIIHNSKMWVKCSKSENAWQIIRLFLLRHPKTAQVRHFQILQKMNHLAISQVGVEKDWMSEIICFKNKTHHGIYKSDCSVIFFTCLWKIDNVAFFWVFSHIFSQNLATKQKTRWSEKPVIFKKDTMINKTGLNAKFKLNICFWMNCVKITTTAFYESYVS